MVQCPGFLLEQRQIVQGFKANILLGPEPVVPCDLFALAVDDHPLAKARNINNKKSIRFIL